MTPIRRLSINQPPERLHQATPAEIDDDFVVLHAIATLHGAKASQKTIVTIAHPSQSAVLEHAPRMHWFRRCLRNLRATFPSDLPGWVRLQLGYLCRSFRYSERGPWKPKVACIYLQSTWRSVPGRTHGASLSHLYASLPPAANDIVESSGNLVAPRRRSFGRLLALRVICRASGSPSRGSWRRVSSASSWSAGR